MSRTSVFCRRILTCGAVLTITAPALAVDNVPTGLLHEGDPYPGGGPDEFVRSLGSLWVNGVGGYGLTLLNEDSSGGSLNFHTLWGNFTGGPGMRIFEEGAVDGNYQAISIQTDAKGDNNGNVYYSASTLDTSTGDSLDAMWINNTALAVEGESIPSLPGMFYSFASGVSVSDDGSRFLWVAGLTSTSGGSTENRALMDQNENVVWKGGDTLPGYSVPLDTSTPTFQTHVSAAGSNYISEANLDTGSSLNDGAMIYNSAALNSHGTNLREGNAVPASTPGMVAGESWDNFDDYRTNEAGDYYVTGDTDASTSVDEFVYANDRFVLREGDIVSHRILPGQSYTLTGSIDGIDLNEDGDWVVRWAIDSSTNDALLLNGKVILQEGDKIDFDGDGAIDPNATISQFTGLDDLAITDRRPNGEVDIYFTADIDTMGTSSTLDGFETYIRVTYTIPAPGVAALLAVAGAAGRRRRRRC